MSKVAVLGTGSWGTALSQVLTDNHHEVCMYGINDKEIEDINIAHRNDKFFDVEINHEIKATNRLEEAIDHADYILITIPTQHIYSVLQEVKKVLRHKVVIINASKGFDNVNNMRISNTIRNIIDSKYREEVVSLIGPSHAEEVVLRKLTLVSAVSIDMNLAKKVQHLFSNSYFRVYRCDDEVGAEYSVALKNVIALASGCISGLGYGDNTRAALITRGLAEMVRYGKVKGGRFETYLGLTGLGDLVVTCSSKYSRNFQAGYEIGQCNDATKWMKSNTKTVEGIRTCKIIHEDLVNYPGLEMPITSAIYRVLYQGAKPKDEIQSLMLRDLKQEV